MELFYWALATEVFLTLNKRLLSYLLIMRLLVHSTVLSVPKLSCQELFAGVVVLIDKLNLLNIVTAQTSKLNLMGWRCGLLCYHVFLRFVEFFDTCKIAVVIPDFCLLLIQQNLLASFNVLLLFLDIRRVFLRNILGNLNFLNGKFE